VYVTAQVDVNVDPIASVQLYYQAAAGPYLAVPMFDDGMHADQSPGDGVYGALLPISATSGQEVNYYVAATASNTYGSVRFLPERTELQPAQVKYLFGNSGMRITEYLYSSTDGEFVELTNTTGASIDLTGWSLDDQSNTPGTFDLSAAGVVAPGQSIVITDADPALFSAAWGLSGTIVLGPTSSASLGRNDEINIFDSAGDLVERLTYGDEDFPGSIRARDASGQGCFQAIGNNNAFGWTLATLGDAWATYTSSGGDLGNPGTFVMVDCDGLGTEYCDPSVTNSTGSPGRLTAFGSPFAEANNVNLVATNLPSGEFGFFLNGTASDLVIAPGGSQGNLCLGGSIGRYNTASQVFAVDASGQGMLTLNLGATPTPLGPTQVLAGQTWYFQVWYRDTAAGTGSSNFTSGLSIDFQ